MWWANRRRQTKTGLPSCARHSSGGVLVSCRNYCTWRTWRRWRTVQYRVAERRRWALRDRALELKENCVGVGWILDGRETAISLIIISKEENRLSDFYHALLFISIFLSPLFCFQGANFSSPHQSSQFLITLQRLNIALFWTSAFFFITSECLKKILFICSLWAWVMARRRCHHTAREL